MTTDARAQMTGPDDDDDRRAVTRLDDRGHRVVQR